MHILIKNCVRYMHILIKNCVPYMHIVIKNCVRYMQILKKKLCSLYAYSDKKRNPRWKLNFQL